MNDTAILQVNQSAVTTSERELLIKCEDAISRGLQSFVDVGNALRTIRDKHLYREKYETFEHYVKERWDIGHAHAYRFIAASETVAVLSPIGDIQPTAESHVRPLLQFPVEDRPAVWATVVKQLPKDVAVTARAIERIVNREIGDSSDKPFKAIRREIRHQRDERRAASASNARFSNRHNDDVVERDEDDDGRYNFSARNNAVAFILEFLKDGQFHPQKTLDDALSAPEYGCRAYINEVKSTDEQQRRLSAVEVSSYTEESVSPMQYAIRQGEQIINVTLHAMVWLGIVDRVENGAQVSYRLLKNPFAVTCPNCGHHEVDDDGDCTSCRAPGIVSMEGSK
jgi:hypothetical protein